MEDWDTSGGFSTVAPTKLMGGFENKPFNSGYGQGTSVSSCDTKVFRGLGRGQREDAADGFDRTNTRQNGFGKFFEKSNGFGRTTEFRCTSYGDDDNSSQSGFGRSGSRNSSGFNNDGGDSAYKRSGAGRGGGGRAGDWTCPKEDCGNNNFGFRQSCPKCGTAKPESSTESTFSSGFGRNQSGGRGFGGERGKKPGEWICPNESCGNNNFAFRTACQKCDTAKPESEYAFDSESGKNTTARPAPYIPPAPSDNVDDIFGGHVMKGINFDRYDEIPVEVSGRDQCGFISMFEEAGLYPTFLSNLKRAKYERPTPIQKYSIPIIMSGRDMMACAQTGSGKTAAFLLPVLTGMVKKGLTTDRYQDIQYPQAICVAPTRELALQIFNDCRRFSYDTEIRAVVLYGGTSLSSQIRQVELGANIVIGTPGRLLDVINRGKINLSKLSYLILDEADRMLDMGFEPEIRKLVETVGMTPKTQRQTLMFSATFPEEIQKLAADFLNDYLFVTIGRVGGANTDVTQNFFEVERLQKRESLCDILRAGGNEKTLVFVEMKRNADFLASYLSQSGFKTTSIHGDRLQKEREEALQDFKIGKCNVLVATSVAARGLDIPEVMHVINYDLPSSIDEYVHRIGRTGRCGNLGKATSFFSADTDTPMAASLVRILKEAQQKVPNWLSSHACGMGAGDIGSLHSKFGAIDIRAGKFGQNSAADSWAAGTGVNYTGGDEEEW